MATKKQNNNTTLYIGLAVLAIGIYLLVKKKKEEQAPPEDKNNSNNNNSNNQGEKNKNTTQKCDEHRILKRGDNSNSWTKSDGSQCNQVRWVQDKLNAKHKEGKIKLPALLIVDGIFGEKTEQAYKIAMGKKQGSWGELHRKYPKTKEQPFGPQLPNKYEFPKP